MSAQLDIVYKLKEALETANPEVAAPFMADDFTHQALPAQYVLLGALASARGRIGTDFEPCSTRLGAPRRTKDQWKAHVIAINSRLKSLKVGTCILSGLGARVT